LIWGEILHDIAAVGPEVQLTGRDAIAEQIMDPAGFRRMQEYLRQKPPATEAQRRKVVAAFLGRYAVEDQLEQIVNLPGWTEDFMAELSEAYDADMDVIAGLPGVTLLSP
jgi:hypothetical protein